MLPDASKRKRLFGFDLKRFDDDYIHKMISEKIMHDGVTTPNAARIIRELNEYMDESGAFNLQASAIFLFMRDMLEGGIMEGDCEIVRLYFENIDRELLGKSMSNVMKIMKSVASQRRLAMQVKKVVKVNRINADWEAILSRFVGDLKKRITFLRGTVIPANLNNTPMGAYSDYLAMNGVDVYEDIMKFIKRDGSMFDEDDETVSAYKDHVLEILRSVSGEQAEALLEKARSGMAARNRRVAAIKRSIKESEEEEHKKKVDECKEMILHLCSKAGPLFRAKRKSALTRRSLKVPYVYVVAAGKAKPFKTGYLTKGNLWYLTDEESARIFDTEEAAEKAAAAYRAQGTDYFAEIAKVEFYQYGIGI